MTAATKKDLERLEQGIAETVEIFLGILAEAAGAVPTAMHLAGAIGARKATNENPVRDRLLERALRAVVLKAERVDPTNPTVQTLVATVLQGRQKH